MEPATHSIGMVGQVFFLDLLLSGDNAIVIALACHGLPPALRRKAVMLGTAVAIGLRVLLSLVTGLLLHVPLLKLVGALLLLAIAIRLLLGEATPTANAPAGDAESDLWRALLVVVGADLALSLDNVVALAAATQGQVAYLALGLLLSVPLLMLGSVRLARLFDAQPLLVPAGAALLGWIAGGLAVTDPLLAGWVSEQAPALNFFVPLAGMVFVLLEARIIREQRLRLGAAPPFPGRRAAAAQGAATAAPGRPAAPAGTDPTPRPAPQTAITAPAEPASVEHAALNFLIPVIVVISLVLLSWVALRVIDAGRFLPAPEHPGGSAHFTH
jgi:YjbE family integral membrane protein